MKDALLKHAFFCDACGKEIVQKREVLLLRRRDDVSDGVIYHVHAHCVEGYVQGQANHWERIPLLSPRAAFLLG